MKFANITLVSVFISVVIALSLFEILPIVYTILQPDFCYGCTSLGKLHQYLNVHAKFAYVNWSAYTVLFLYLLNVSRNIHSNLFKYAAIACCVFMLLLPVMPISNIITFILSLYYDNPPFIHDYQPVFPASSDIENSYHAIKSEYEDFTSEYKADCIRKSNPAFTIENTSDDNNCWRGLYLKRAGTIDESQTKHFSKTIACLRNEQIHNAFFSILDPGVEIPGHTGYYKGYLRYHLGVDIPNNSSLDDNSKAYIVCGEEKYVWKNGEGIVFDDMYYHYVKNPSNQTRVVLYLDIKRKTENVFIDSINNLGMWLVENSVFLKFFIQNQHNQIKIEK